MSLGHNELTHKHLETNKCVLSTVATDALVLKHQTISIPSADQICIEFHMFRNKHYIHSKQH